MRRYVGLVMALGGLVLMASVYGQHLLGSHQVAQAQERLAKEVPDQPVVVPGHGVPVARAVRVGHALAVMRIPRFGRSWSWVASEGTTAAVLEGGPGHYVGTALPGERGNAAFAAHRAGHGDPFIDFDRLRPGDTVELRQGRTTWTYVVDTVPKIIPTTAAWVLDRLPGRRLTLTTCWPRYGSSKRMFVRGHLVA
jgi:sortase A